MDRRRLKSIRQTIEPNRQLHVQVVPLEGSGSQHVLRAETSYSGAIGGTYAIQEFPLPYTELERRDALGHLITRGNEINELQEQPNQCIRDHL